MSFTQIRSFEVSRVLGLKRVAVVLTGVLSATVLASQIAAAPVAQAASYTSRTSAKSAAIGSWVSTGRRAYAMSDFHGDPYANSFGACTWYAWYRHQGEPLMQLGNAAQWAGNAPAHGLSTGTTPAAGATVIFQSGVQGASGLGHVGHVEAVYSGGWFLISEMAFSWDGGGWGRVSYRYAHTGSGVSFIY